MKKMTNLFFCILFLYAGLVTVQAQKINSETLYEYDESKIVIDTIPLDGFPSEPIPKPAYANKTLVYKNAPYIVEGHSLIGLNSKEFNFLKISQSEKYLMADFAIRVKHKYQSELLDTITVLVEAVDYNYIYKGAIINHAVNKGVHFWGVENTFLFLEEKWIDGKKYYIPTNYDYRGFVSWGDWNKYIAERIIFGERQMYSHQQVLDTIQKYAGKLKAEPTSK